MADFISIIAAEGKEFKLVFTEAEANSPKFIMKRVCEGQVIDIAELEHAEHGRWKAVSSEPVWAANHEEKISMFIEKYRKLAATA